VPLLVGSNNKEMVCGFSALPNPAGFPY